MKALKEHKLLLLLQEQKNELNVRLPAIEPKDVAARKNAVILHTSFDGGKTFQLHPANKYCPRCGDKVLFCPHLSLHASTLSFSDKAVIKFIRPDLKLRTIENIF